MQRACIVFFSLGGYRLYATGGVEVRGFLDPARFERMLAAGELRHLDFTACVLVDARSPMRRSPALAMPRVNADLPPAPGELTGAAAYMPPGLQGVWGCLAAIGDRPAPVDCAVSPELYAALWARAGARIGVIRDGRIVWVALDRPQKRAARVVQGELGL